MTLSSKIPITVIVTTRNEGRNIERCLKALMEFDEVIVVDSDSSDDTVEIAKSYNTKIVRYEWNGQYPKKRQWCLDTINFKNDYIFFVDADEVIPLGLIKELKNLDMMYDGYFVKGAYVIDGKVLQFGLQNNKLCLFHHKKFYFPVIDDLHAPGMGEIEGHYQPVPKNGIIQTGQIKTALHHYACEDWQKWDERHDRYARWEAYILNKAQMPGDPILWRQFLKLALRSRKVKGLLLFIFGYFIRLGFLDGREGFAIAYRKLHYYFL